MNWFGQTGLGPEHDETVAKVYESLRVEPCLWDLVLFIAGRQHQRCVCWIKVRQSKLSHAVRWVKGAPPGAWASRRPSVFHTLIMRSAHAGPVYHEKANWNKSCTRAGAGAMVALQVESGRSVALRRIKKTVTLNPGDERRHRCSQILIPGSSERGCRRTPAVRGHDNGANANDCADVAGAQRRCRRVLNTYDMLYSERSNEFCDVTAKPARDAILSAECLARRIEKGAGSP